MPFRYGTMEFRQIRYFLEISRAGSFQKAALRLGLTQPALSRQIALLERELGQTLLERGPREVRLTPGGETALEYAVRLHDLWREMQDRVARPAQDLGGEFSISTGGTVAAWVLPGALGRLRRDFPELVLRVSEGDAQETREAVLRGDADLGILTGPLRDAALNQKYFFSDRILPVAAKSHPIFRKKRPRLEDIAGENFVLFHPASAIRRVVEKKLRGLRSRIRPQAVMELRSVESVIRSIEAGLGIGFVSELSLTEELRPLPAAFADLGSKRDFYFCHRRAGRPGLGLLIEALERYASETGLKN